MRSFLLIAFLSSIAALSAQIIPCTDSTRVNALYQCNDQYYNPVCGCNNVTYRNQCDAFSVHGVNNWRSGVCSGMDLDFYPNPIGPNSKLTINLSFDEFVYGNATIRIVDLYGKTWEQRQLNYFNRTNVEFDTYTLRTGLYFIVATSSLNSYTVRKLVKY